MLFKHKGDSVLEWIDLAVLVLIVLGTAALALANEGSTRSGEVTTWLQNIAP